MKYSNKLIQETSPYLLQHAHNPVDWYPWGEEALIKAKQEDKLIIVSIGYAACHWCHVMEKESFEDVATASIMNHYFVCIKIDREERPDLDHFFMDALQATSGNGGWPLNMFLTSDGKPFYGGTYFPPRRLHNRPSWQEVLMQIQQAYQSRRKEIEDQANNLVDYLTKANQTPHLSTVIDLENDLFSLAHCEKALEGILTMADQVYGGFGKAPKFPQTFTIQYLLRFSHFTGHQLAFEQAELSLKSMMRGGIYDQIGGGFCRYSTDTAWLAPHFEKMTYDNALLLGVISEVFQINRDDEYKRVAHQTIDFMKREMMSAECGFYAALDADSEGVEGKYYTWKLEEFEEILKDDAQLMSSWFDVSAEGNWEGVNILRINQPLDTWSEKNGLTTVQALTKIEAATVRLLNARNKRIRPGTDDKIILGWNALFNQALVKASLAFDEPSWLELAEKNIDFLLATFYHQEESLWKHTYKRGEAKYPAFLDDLAYLIQALLSIYEPTGNVKYLEKARDVILYVQQFFMEESGLFYYYTPSFQEDILVRKKDIYDGAMPSGNALMAWNLHRAGILMGQEEWRLQAVKMVDAVKEGVLKYPNSFGVWANLMLELVQGTHEILVLGQSAKEEGLSLMGQYIPNKVVMLSTEAIEQYPLMRQKKVKDQTTFYVCKNYNCQLPLTNLQEVLLKVLTN